MKLCWAQNPKDRPAFAEIVKTLPKSGKKMPSEQTRRSMERHASVDELQEAEDRVREELEAEKKRKLKELQD